MNLKYYQKISKILAQADPRLISTHNLEFKNCFGAVAGYVNGQIFCSCGKFGFALKMSPKTIAQLISEGGVKHLKYFPNGHIKKDYLVLSKKILDDNKKFKALVNKSLKFVLIED